MQVVNTQDFERSQQKQMDSTLLVRFFVKAMEDKTETKKHNRPIFRDVEFVEIRTPGNRDAICRPARQRDIDRFPDHYKAFKDRTSTEHLEGTPLSEWPLMSRSRVEELAFHNVKTVEQLAGMPDSNISQFMGMSVMKEKALKWLDHADERIKADQLKNELAQRDNEIAELKKMVQSLAERIEKSEKEAKIPKPRAYKKRARVKKE